MTLDRGFPCGSAGKESTCNAGNLGSIPGLGRSPGVGNGNPLQYSYLGNPMDRGASGHKELDTTERLTLTPFSLVDKEITLEKRGDKIEG